MWAQGSRITLSLRECSSKHMQHSRLFSSTRSSGVTETIGSWRIMVGSAGGAARVGCCDCCDCCCCCCCDCDCC